MLSIMLAWDMMASYFFKLTMETQSGKRKVEIGLPTSSRQQKRVHECTCLETHIPRNGHTLCRQNATITHFVKFVTTVFSLRMAVGIIGVRANIHLGGQTYRVLPEWRTQLVCHAAPPGRKNNELTQCLFLTVVDYTR